jgi:DNA-binding GntR family transcriptional regulator
LSIANKTLEYWILHILNLEDCARGAGSLLVKLKEQSVNTSEAGVGRALRAMRHSGLLEKAGKQGHRITDAGRSRLAKAEEERELRGFLADIINHPGKLGRTNLLHRLVVRKALEREAVYRATLNATDKELGEIEKIVAAQYEGMKKNEDYSELSARFHRSILRASGIPLLETMYDLIGITSNWQDFFVGTFKLYDTPVNVSHEKIVRAMKARDPEAAAAAMGSHLEDVITNAQKLAGEGGG